MGTKMTLSARAELTNAVRRRYGVATGAEKRKILDEFIAVTGYHEKSAIRALNAEPTVKRRQTRARPSLYDEAVRATLIVLWEACNKPRGPAPVPYSCVAHLTEMHQWLEEHPDQTAKELLIEFQARYPGIYRLSHLRTLRKRVQVWRRAAIQRLIFRLQDHTQDVGSETELLAPSASDRAWFKIDKILTNTPSLTAAGNIVHEALGNKIT